MRFLACVILFFLSMISLAQENFEKLQKASGNSLFKNAVSFYTEGKYFSTIEELASIEANLSPKADNSVRGLIAYWKGICYSRVQNFPEAITSFSKSLSLNFAPKDLHYEYGQALFAAEKLSEARLQFRESLKKKFKRGVSLYYIAFISKEMGEKSKAFSFFRSINKLDPAEVKEVQQPSEMHIGDLYLEQVEKESDAFKSIENVVIPQYKRALDLNPESGLAPLIKDKIVKLQTKYDLILFQLRNGRPTLNPPHFLRIAQEIGMDSNVTFSPAETTISKARQGSTFSKTDFIGRYTFYHEDYFSIAPELRFNSTYYFNRVPEIYRNDNYLIAPAIRTAYEHSLWNKPASFLVDYDYNESRRDVNSRQKLDFSSRSHTLMLGERFNYFNTGESILRLRYRMLESYVNASDSTMTSLVYEQLKSLKLHTLLFFFSYDRMRVQNNLFDSDSLTFRTDLIMARFRDWFTPSFSLALTSTDPINDQENRGRELLINPSFRLSKTYKKNWRANARFDYQSNQSKDKTNFAYKKQVYAFELEYLF